MPCEWCTLLRPPYVRNSTGSYLSIEYNDVLYATDSIIPLDLSTNDDYHVLKITAFCTSICHLRRSLRLRIKPILQNVLEHPGDTLFGIYQEPSILTYRLRVRTGMSI